MKPRVISVRIVGVHIEIRTKHLPKRYRLNQLTRWHTSIPLTNEPRGREAETRGALILT
jgi:hypothetical protein